MNKCHYQNVNDGDFMPRKKTVKISNHVTLTKIIDDELSREAKNRGMHKNQLIEDALNEYFRPVDKENHERHTKMQLARLQREVNVIQNKLDIIMIQHEEAIKSLYSLIPEIEIDPSDEAARTAIRATVKKGQDNYNKRVIESSMGNRPNILSALNISKSTGE